MSVFFFRDLLMDSYMKWKRMLAQLGCGAAVVDLLAAVAAYPKPDDKIRTTSLKVRFYGFWLLVCAIVHSCGVVYVKICLLEFNFRT